MEQTTSQKSVLDFIRNNGGYWFGHLPVIRPLIVELEDLLNNKGRPTAKWRTNFARTIHRATGNSIFYLDFANGNDGNDGTTWANAWKTINSGATSARTAPGDVIRIAKSPDPTSMSQNAQWTNLSRTVTLTTAVTAVIEDCEDAWTASANVTDSSSTTNKQGTNSRSLAIASGFTTGKIAYETLTSTDFSAYQQVSFWIRANLAVASGVLELRLCSDTIGATAVNTIAIPAIPATNVWQVVTVDTGGALGSAIQSVALHALSDPGTVTLLIDNIIACKASSSADSLTLSSLISKSSSAQGGTEGWYGIQSIAGTTITLDANTNTDAGVGEGYAGTTESVNLYKRETIKIAPVNGAVVGGLKESGTIGLNIEYQGGYDTGSSTQNGETIVDGQNGSGTFLEHTSRSFTLVNYLGVCRYTIGITVGDSTNVYLGFIRASNCTTGISASSTSTNHATMDTLVLNNNTTGLDTDFNGAFFEIGTIVANNNTTTGVSNKGSNNIIQSLTVKNNVNGLELNRGDGLIVNEYISSDNSTCSILVSSNSRTGGHVIRKANISEGTVVSYSGQSFANVYIYVTATNGYTTIYTDGGNIVSEASTLTNGSGTQWKFTTATNTNRQSNYPLSLPIARIACSANNQVTVKAWFKKGHATNIDAQLICRKGQIAGVTSDVTAVKADDTNEEELTITFTPTEAGVVEIEAQAWYVAGHSTVIVDALTITQA